MQEIWLPAIMFYSVRKLTFIPSLTKKRNSVAWLYVPKNSLEFSTSLEVTITCTYDFYSYPFDSHVCPVNFGDSDYENSSVVSSYFVILIKIAISRVFFGR